MIHTNPARNPYRFRRNLTVIAFSVALIVVALLSAAMCLVALKGGH